MTNLRHRIELAIMGRTAPRAADAVMAILAEHDAEWLRQMFVEPARELATLPEWARPVVTPAPEPPYDEEQWQAERDDPEAGHTFRIEAHSRGSYAVIGEDGKPGPHTDAEWMPEHPFVIEVRAWSLRDAMAKAAHLPLPLWRLTP